MSNNALRTIAMLIAYGWTALVFGVCTYLVFWQGHSGWWFVLAFLLVQGSSD